jgi:CrcB protein
VSVAVWLGVAALGGLGALLRFLVDRQVARRTPSGFPFGTLTVNLSGAVVLGLFSGLALDSDAALLAGTALVGSYTTFSTWMLETQRLGEERQVGAAAANLGLSLVLGVGAAALGRLLGGTL